MRGAVAQGLLGAAVLVGASGCRHEVVRTYPAAASAPAVYPAAAGKAAAPAPPAAPRREGPAEVTIPAGARALSTEVGVASWYGTVYDHRRGADGTVYDQEAMTAASRTIPLGAVARVTNLATGDDAVVKITDRGPFVPGRILDLSAGAARALGVYRAGVARVRVEAFASEQVAETPGKWCVQIGAFLDPDDARQLKNDLLRRYGSAKAISFTGPTGSWVRLIPAGSEREQSEAIASEVRVPDPEVGAYVTRLN